MPIIRSAIKRMRQDKIKAARHHTQEIALKKLIKNLKRYPNSKNLSATFSALDKLAKIHLVHKNKAARLKSRLSKLAAVQ